MPGGVFLLWLVVVGLVVLALWQILVAVTARSAGTTALEVTKAVVYAALAGITVSIAIGSRSDASSTEKSNAARLALTTRTE